MLEFYAAYADYRDLMDLTEQLLRELCQQLFGATTLNYQGAAIDFGKPFARLTMKESILKFNPDLVSTELDELGTARGVAARLGCSVADGAGLGRAQTEIFERTVESQLIAPTFITDCPAEVSPLAPRSDRDPDVTDRFELMIAGREIANGFSELNDPEDQADRFRQQLEAKAGGDQEAMDYDADYITALEHGLPPTAGEGIGIDRQVMLLTDSASIRDVVLFPPLRPRAE